MTENHKQPIVSDEIDLTALLATGLKGLKKNLKAYLVAIIGGALLGYLFYLSWPKLYESKMLISSDILTESYSKTITADLKQLIEEKNFTQLSSKLNLSEDQAAAVKSIEVNAVLEKADIAENQKTYLTITCRSADNRIWPDLQKGLIEFYERNDFVRIRVNHRIKYNSAIIEKIDKELHDLDELKQRIIEGQIAQTSKDNLVLFDPTTVNTKILELNKEKINLQNGLEVINSIQVVESFTAFDKPVFPKRSISIMTGSVLGLLLAVILLSLRALNKIIHSQEKLA